jgi:transcriptional regulator with GAF, ATPase, and Fis domain
VAVVRSLGSITDSARPGSDSGFTALDEYLLGDLGGLVIARVPSLEAATATVAHVVRRAQAAGGSAVQARATEGASLWRDVASRLGLRTLASDPARAAEAIARTAIAQRAVIIAAMPAEGSWDRSVAHELSFQPSPPAVVFVSPGTDGGDGLCAKVFEIRPTLDATERQRWWTALAEAAPSHVAADTLVALEAWWTNAGESPASGGSAELSVASTRLFAALGLAARAWAVAEVSAIQGDQQALLELVRAHVARVSAGWITIEANNEARANQAAAEAPPTLIEAVARALVTTNGSHDGDDPWAQARAAELLIRIGAWDDADQAQARALTAAEDWLIRRELILRWRDLVGVAPSGGRLPLATRAAERALAIGEAEEAFAWAKSAMTIAPDDPQVTLIVGRASLALGDLVSSRAALERGAKQAASDAERATFAAELAEVAYLAGDADTAAAEANLALSLSGAPAVRLRARNTLGKLLLARSAWDDADRHFAEDAVAASAVGLSTEELRARSNRGIALLSKGLIAEAGAMFEAVLVEGERLGDARACAFAFDNLLVLAMMRHQYADALALAEKALLTRRRVGDRVATARLLGNLAELRRSLGLLDHAEHAVAFGRRALGPGMPPGRSAFLSIQAARNALARGNTVEAGREAARALAESETAGTQSYVAEALLVDVRIAQEDGDLARSARVLERACPLATTDELRGEAAILNARQARASGSDAEGAATEALRAARASGKEDLVIEALWLLAEIHQSLGNDDAARGHVGEAIGLRDQVASTLPHDVRASFLARPDLRELAKQHLASAEAKCDRPPTPVVSRTTGANGSVPARREIVGDDPSIRGLLAAVKRVARSNTTILIRGESGTGKELVAEAIHQASERASGPLVTVNCAALVETLLLSELFGHEKGAFTGAIARRRGRFELAEQGTLFLDEIGDISPRTQVALLRVLQERAFERVGGTTVIRADVRVVCATHRDLRAMVERGEFREDLYYRLRGITLEVPPLRARMGDLAGLSTHLLGRIASERGEKPKTLSGDALDVLRRHRWPGNVRELENTLRAASLFAEGSVITAATLVESATDLGFTFSLRPTGVLAETEDVAPDSATTSRSPATHAPADPGAPADIAYSQVRGGGVSLPKMKRQIERDCIARALAETRGNIARAAALLGMKRPRLSQLVREYGLSAIPSEDR